MKKRRLAALVLTTLFLMTTLVAMTAPAAAEGGRKGLPHLSDCGLPDSERS